MIVIKDMDMPKKCDQVINGEVIRCPLLDDDDCCRGQEEEIRNSVETWDEQMKHCPLQEIGGTNGEVMQSLFPNGKINKAFSDNDFVVVELGDVNVGYSTDWWNSPYKAESSGEVNCN